ncbi:MAG: hypothetical protein ACFB21_07815 [Opitutales bacterium]
MTKSFRKHALHFHLLVFVALSGTSCQRNSVDGAREIPVWTGAIYITMPNIEKANQPFISFLRQNVGEVVFIDILIDMSLWDEQMANRFERLELGKFASNSEMQLQVGNDAYLTLQLLENHRLLPSGGGTGVYAFPVLGSFRIEVIPEQIPLYVLREIHPPTQRISPGSRFSLRDAFQPASR